MFLRTSKFFVYIVKCKNGNYYTGYTNNLEKRIELHNKGHGAKYLRGKLPVTLVYAKEYRYYKNAVKAEREIKTYSRKEKEELIRNFIPPVLFSPRTYSASAKLDRGFSRKYEKNSN